MNIYTRALASLSAKVYPPVPGISLFGETSSLQLSVNMKLMGDMRRVNVLPMRYVGMFPSHLFSRSYPLGIALRTDSGTKTDSNVFGIISETT
jgi:hypothetical protein